MAPLLRAFFFSNHYLMKTLVFAILLLFSGAAQADAFYKLVGYICDKGEDRLILTYDAAANSEGEKMMADKRANQWDPWTLITMSNESKIDKLLTIKRACVLSDGNYTISLGPVPGNMNTVGMCGAWMSAWAEVYRGNTVIFPRSNFESGVGCFYADGEIVTRVEIRPKQKLKITKFPAEKLLSGM